MLCSVGSFYWEWCRQLPHQCLDGLVAMIGLRPGCHCVGQVRVSPCPQHRDSGFWDSGLCLCSSWWVPWGRQSVLRQGPQCPIHTVETSVSGVMNWLFKIPPCATGVYLYCNICLGSQGVHNFHLFVLTSSAGDVGSIYYEGTSQLAEHLMDSNNCLPQCVEMASFQPGLVVLLSGDTSPQYIG